MPSLTYRPRRSVTRYRAGQAERCCAGCESWLPETVQHFYHYTSDKRTGEWSTHCRMCERERRLMAYHAKREAAA